MAFRLGAGSPEHASALALSGAQLFDPSGGGRPFEDWVAVPSTYGTHLPDFARSALAKVG
ncbi:hypothetical protein WEH80_12010 [Actinomycetes bacterium KLBMP 9759]